MSLPWPGVLDPGLLKDEVVARNHRLADAAKAARWSEVFELLELQWVSVNQWRVGGSSWFAPLHQAAWHGASASVVTGLLERGALRSLRDRDGRTPYDIAAARGHTHLLELLSPVRTRLTPERVAELDTGLATVIDGRLRLTGGIAESYGKPLEDCLRYPPVAVLPECPDGRLWFAVPGMYGGFSIELMKGSYLYVESWIRVVGDSGQAHVVTHEGVTLVDEGFVYPPRRPGSLRGRPGHHQARLVRRDHDTRRAPRAWGADERTRRSAAWSRPVRAGPRRTHHAGGEQALPRHGLVEDRDA